MAAGSHLGNLVWGLLLLGSCRSKTPSRTDVLEVVEEDFLEGEFPSFLESLSDGVAESYKFLLDEYEDLSSDPLMPKPSEAIPSSCFAEKPAAELKQEVERDVNTTKTQCMTLAAIALRDCKANAPCPKVTNATEKALEYPDCEKEVAGDDCSFLSDPNKKAECTNFRNSKLKDCQLKLQKMQADWEAEMLECEESKKQCKADYGKAAHTCVQKAVVAQAVGDVRVEAAELYALQNATLENGKLDLSDVEYAGLMETPDFKAALDAAKACAGTNELYYEMVAKTVATLVKDWKAVFAEFQEKKRKIANLDLAQYKAECLPKEYAAMSAMGDFSSKAGFLKTLAYACGSGCAWDGEDCRSASEKERVQTQERAYKQCFTELLASGSVPQLQQASQHI